MLETIKTFTKTLSLNRKNEKEKRDLQNNLIQCGYTDRNVRLFLIPSSMQPLALRRRKSLAHTYCVSPLTN